MIRRAAGPVITRQVLLLVGMLCVAGGTLDTMGYVGVRAVALVTIGCLLLLLAARAPTGPPAPSALWWGVGASSGLLTCLYWSALGSWQVELAGVVLCSLAIAAVVAPAGRRVLAAAAALCTLVALSCTWQWGWQGIDVLQSTSSAAAAVAHGHNPYGATFLLYVPHGATHAYEPATFQYGPTTVLLAVPGHLLGDVRLPGLLAAVLIGVSVWRIAGRAGRLHGDRIGFLAASSPMTLGLLHWGWVDVYMLAGFAGWMALRQKHPWWGAISLAVGITVKPVILVAIVPLLVWSPGARRDLARAAPVAAALIAPFLIVPGPRTLFQDVLGVQLALPARPDSLTISSLVRAYTGHDMPSAISITVVLLVAAAVLLRRPRDQTDVLASGAGLTGLVFLLSKWAFFNYYLVVVVVSLVALACDGVPGTRLVPQRAPARRLPDHSIPTLQPG